MAEEQGATEVFKSTFELAGGLKDLAEAVKSAPEAAHEISLSGLNKLDAFRAEGTLNHMEGALVNTGPQLLKIVGDGVSAISVGIQLGQTVSAAINGKEVDVIDGAGAAVKAALVPMGAAAAPIAVAWDFTWGALKAQGQANYDGHQDAVVNQYLSEYAHALRDAQDGKSLGNGTDAQLSDLKDAAHGAQDIVTATPTIRDIARRDVQNELAKLPPQEQQSVLGSLPRSNEVLVNGLGKALGPQVKDALNGKSGEGAGNHGGDGAPPSGGGQPEGKDSGPEGSTTAPTTGDGSGTASGDGASKVDFTDGEAGTIEGERGGSGESPDGAPVDGNGVEENGVDGSSDASAGGASGNSGDGSTGADGYITLDANYDYTFDGSTGVIVSQTEAANPGNGTATVVGGSQDGAVYEVAHPGEDGGLLLPDNQPITFEPTLVVGHTGEQTDAPTEQGTQDATNTAGAPPQETVQGASSEQALSTVTAAQEVTEGQQQQTDTATENATGANDAAQTQSYEQSQPSAQTDAAPPADSATAAQQETVSTSQASEEAGPSDAAAAQSTPTAESGDAAQMALDGSAPAAASAESAPAPGGDAMSLSDASPASMSDTSAGSMSLDAPPAQESSDAATSQASSPAESSTTPAETSSSGDGQQNESSMSLDGNSSSSTSESGDAHGESGSAGESSSSTSSSSESSGSSGSSGSSESASSSESSSSSEGSGAEEQQVAY